MTCHITMERIAPPEPLEPVVLSIAQANFLRLHAHHIVYRWQWYFSETQLRAHTTKTSATIWRDELDDLVRRGLVERGLGVSVCLTKAGHAAANAAVPNRLKGARILDNGDAT